MITRVPTGLQDSQVALDVAPVAIDDVPAGQLRQAGEPEDGLYVPCDHMRC